MRVLFLLAILCELGASPIGNPSAPALLEEGFVLPDTSWIHPQFGFIGDYLAQKKMRSCHSSKHLHLHKAFLSGTSELATASWSLREKFNLQLQAGSGQFSWRWQQMGKNIEGRSSGGVVWAGDAKLIILAVKERTFAADAQAGGWDWMRGASTINAVHSTKNAISQLRFWQLAFALTQKIGLFAPYLGYAVNASRFKVSHLPTGTGRIRSHQKTGPFGGCSLSTGNRFLGNFEWRGWFEEGVTLSAQVRF